MPRHPTKPIFDSMPKIEVRDCNKRRACSKVGHSQDLNKSLFLRALEGALVDT